jgi:hypothetical protein
MSAVKPRHEYKYLISAQDAFVLKARLSGLLEEDIHGDKAGGYLVNSLYFDTPFLNFAEDKESGVFERVKYRIRTYGDEGTSFRLERKAKQGSLCFKTSCAIDSSFILAPDLYAAGTDDGLYNGFMARRRAGLLKPAVIVRYRRRAFCREPGRIRITFDDGLCALPASAGFSPCGKERVPLLQNQSAILEVKFDDFLPDSIKSLLGLSARPPLSISKYLLCLKAVQY